MNAILTTNICIRRRRKRHFEEAKKYSRKFAKSHHCIFNGSGVMMNQAVRGYIPPRVTILPIDDY
jgi:hypothetical protein